MQQRLRDLEVAIETALSDGETDRALRLVITNLPRYPWFPGVRRHVGEVLRQQGDHAAAASVFEWVSGLELLGGDLLRSLADLLSAAALNEDIAAKRDDLISDAIARGFDHNGLTWETIAVPAPSLSGDRPPLPIGALLPIAKELATKRASGETQRRDAHRPVTLLQDLGVGALRFTLNHLELSSLEDGQALVTAERPIAWLVRGRVREAEAVHEIAPGAMVGPAPEGGQLVAHGRVQLLGLPQAAWIELIGLPGVQSQLGATLRQRRMLSALRRCTFVSRLGHESLRVALSVSRGRVANAEVLIEKDDYSDGISVVVSGEIQIMDGDPGTGIVVATLLPGDVFGEIGLLTGAPATRSVYAAGFVEFITVPADVVITLLESETMARGYLEELASQRLSAVGSLATSEMQLIED